MTDNKEITIIENRDLTVNDIASQLKMVNELYKTVMIKDEHYGKIPGTKKDTLFKAGAEKLNLLFKLVPKVDDKIVRDIENIHREYEITIGLYHKITGELWGQGVGSCSTLEKKYRYRWNNGQRVENEDIADQYNTVLKMAYKRALVSATISATGVSDIFTQDVEDMDLQPKKKQEQKDPKLNAKEYYNKFWNDLSDDYKFELKDMSDEERYDMFVKCKWDIAELDAEIIRRSKENAADKAVDDIRNGDML